MLGGQNMLTIGGWVAIRVSSLFAQRMGRGTVRSRRRRMVEGSKPHQAPLFLLTDHVGAPSAPDTPSPGRPTRSRSRTGRPGLPRERRAASLRRGGVGGSYTGTKCQRSRMGTTPRLCGPRSTLGPGAAVRGRDGQRQPGELPPSPVLAVDRAASWVSDSRASHVAVPEESPGWS